MLGFTPKAGRGSETLLVSDNRDSIALEILRFAAFADGATGGNPAGVVFARNAIGDAEMQKIAADVGYSETVFAVPDGERWRVRYFSPASEVPFCGHATIALGAALAMQHGHAIFALDLNDASVTVEGRSEGDLFAAALQSPTTASTVASEDLVRDALSLFAYRSGDVDLRIPPAVTEAGAKHLVLALKTRSHLVDMRYELGAGRDLMNRAGLVTINLVYAETPRLFHSRNAFASGGVYEDPATGAAAAALAGYLRDIKWPHGGGFTIVQGEDMGMRSLLKVALSDLPGSSVRVSGTARLL